MTYTTIARAEHGGSAWTFVVAWSDDEGGSLEPLVLSVRCARGLKDALEAAAGYLARLYNDDNDRAVPAHQVFPGPDPSYSAIAHVLYVHQGFAAPQPVLPFQPDAVLVEIDAGNGDAAGGPCPQAGGAA